MLIKEVEIITGITSKNIRFYEKAGLLSPERKSENRYRHYSDEDVRQLKEIKLLRKLGIGLSDIKSIQEGNLTLSECLSKYLILFIQQKKELEKIIGLCSEIHEKETDLRQMDPDFYLDEIKSAEKDGAKFTNIVKDFINKAQSALPAYFKTFFEPDEPIMDCLDFLVELEKYAARNNKSLTIIKLSMVPRIMLDGMVYICLLEMPRVLHFPLSIFFAHYFNFGYRWVYIYEDTTQEW